jgi:hypothetical protein
MLSSKSTERVPVDKDTCCLSVMTKEEVVSSSMH